MNVLVILLQVALAVVLVTAAIGKFLDLSGSRQAVREFGVPEPLASLGGTALPAIELALAAGLLAAPTARWAALLSALLFLAFIAAIGRSLSQGRQPECHCFGQIHSEPAGWPTVARNTVLTLAAALLAWNGGRNPVGWIGDLSTGGRVGMVLGIVILAVASIVSWLLYQLVQQNGRILGRLDRLGDSSSTIDPVAAEAQAPAALDVARIAPEFDIPDLKGQRLTLKNLLNGGQPVLLVFYDPNCAPCQSLVPDIAEWQKRYADNVRVALISHRTGGEDLARTPLGAMPFVGYQEQREIDELYDVRGTPSGILIQPDGTIRHQMASGPAMIRALFSRTVANRRRAELGQAEMPEEEEADWGDDNVLNYLPASLEVGAPAPALPLRDLDGHFSGLDDYRGQEAIVVFMSPSCTFSQRMLPDLHEWANEEAGEVLQRLVIVSDGTADENRKMDLPGRILLDPDFTMGRAFGASGTPAAVLVDGEGRVASPLAVGEDAVLDLLYEQSEAAEQVPV